MDFTDNGRDDDNESSIVHDDAQNPLNGENGFCGDDDTDGIHRTQASSSEMSSLSISPSSEEQALPWEPSGVWWRDMLYFVGPGE